MIQLAFGFGDPVAVRIKAPSLDRTTVRALEKRGVLYRRTIWSAHWKEWQHEVLVCPRHEQHLLIKNDAGITAMLAEQGKERPA